MVSSGHGCAALTPLLDQVPQCGKLLVQTCTGWITKVGSEPFCPRANPGSGPARWQANCASLHREDNAALCRARSPSGLLGLSFPLQACTERNPLLEMSHSLISGHHCLRSSISGFLPHS
eukprot:1160729-Pelagomonas_calceolata.AAC.4